MLYQYHIYRLIAQRIGDAGVKKLVSMPKWGIFSNKGNKKGKTQGGRLDIHIS